MPDFSSTKPQIMVKDPNTGQFSLWSARQIVDFYRNSPVIGSRVVQYNNGSQATRDLTPALNVSADWYMSAGPGQHVNPYQFDIVRNIFDNPNRLAPGQSMRVEDYATNFGVSRNLPQQEYLRSLQLGNNFGWAYILGETAFALKGTINRDLSGELTITNVQIKPRDDQFNIEPDKDWFGQGALANVSNAFLDSNRIPKREVPLIMDGNGAFFADMTRAGLDSPMAYRAPYNTEFPFCFLPGTEVLITNGSMKAIELIQPGDIVASYDPIGRLNGGVIPGKVTRIFANTTRNIIDLRGLHCTPGHHFLTIDKECINGFSTIAQILKDDGVLIKQDGLVIRARTGEAVDKDCDSTVRVVFTDGSKVNNSELYRTVLVRAGIPLPRNLIKNCTANENSDSLTRQLTGHGITILPDSSLCSPDGTYHYAIEWPEGSTPFDTHEARNWIVEVDGKPYTPPWIRDLVEEDEHQGLRVVGAMPTVGGTAVPPRPL